MKAPPYFVETAVPGAGRNCHNFICRWRNHGPDSLGKDYDIILECHEYDSLEMAETLNRVDPDAELFHNPLGER